MAGRRWGVVTAWNPGAQVQQAPVNRAAHDALSTRTAHLCRLDAISGEGRWQEEALLLLDTSLSMTVQLGREFGQAAVLFGVGRRVALVWCGPAPVQVERFWAVAHRGKGQRSTCIL